LGRHGSCKLGLASKGKKKVGWVRTKKRQGSFGGGIGLPWGGGRKMSERTGMKKIQWVGLRTK